jgi:hypothetical protein
MLDNGATAEEMTDMGYTLFTGKDTFLPDVDETPKADEEDAIGSSGSKGKAKTMDKNKEPRTRVRARKVVELLDLRSDRCALLHSKTSPSSTLTHPTTPMLGWTPTTTTTISRR